MKQNKKEREAGRELDAEIAMGVMGATWVSLPPAHEGLYPIGIAGADCLAWCFRLTGEKATAEEACPHFSTDIAAAFQVVEAMRAKGFRYRVGTGFVDDLSACFWMPTGFVATYVVEGTSLPLIICQCALKALERLTPEKASVSPSEKSSVGDNPEPK